MVALECSVDDIPNLDKLAGRLNGRIPSGGSGKGGLEISRRELDEIISRGSNAMVDMGYAYDDDLKNIESNGVLETDEGVSEESYESWNESTWNIGFWESFLGLQTVQSIEDSNPHNLFEGQVVCMIHSGSRGLGHQVCTDHVRGLKISIEIDKVLGTTTIGDLKFKIVNLLQPQSIVERGNHISML